MIKTSQPPARPNHLPILFDYPAFQRDPLGFWLQVGQTAPVVRVRLGPNRPYWVVTDADFFQHILQNKARNYPRDRQLRDRTGLDPAETSFNAPTWDEWLWRRRLLQPAFHGRELARFGASMVEEVRKLVAETAADQPLDLIPWMKTLTMRIICRTMFSASIEETDTLQESFEQTTAFNYKRMSSIFNLPLWIPTPAVQQTKKAIQTRREIIHRIVQQRLDTGQAKGDLLDMLISAHLDEDGRKFTGEDLISEMISIVFAGHETTAMTLVWVFYLLSQHPDIEAAVRHEVKRVLENRLPTLNDIEAMPLTHQVILETLRLYPSVYLTLREAEEEDRLGEYLVPAGTQFILNIRGLHRDSRYWRDDPYEFKPSRHALENSESRHKYAFLPFITGPKKCIGDSFAMMELRLVVPTILQLWKMATASSAPAREKAGFVMDVEQPIIMNLKTNQ
ncbi:MAG: cytochrome P450 [Ardenticatenaceae bacterium]|nr:cytochrome P450 [Ardenticatenaceae bacterium]